MRPKRNRTASSIPPKNEAKQMKDDIVKDAKKELSEVVLGALDKIVSDGLTQEDKKKLTEKAVKEI